MEVEDGSDSKTAGLRGSRLGRRDPGLGMIKSNLFLCPGRVPAEGGAFSSSHKGFILGW